MYAFKRGDTIELALGNLDGLEVLRIDAALKVEGRGAPEGNILGYFNLTAVEAVGPGLEAGWLLRLDDALAVTLPLGIYTVDARLEVTGKVVISQRAQFVLEESVTATRKPE